MNIPTYTICAGVVGQETTPGKTEAGVNGSCDSTSTLLLLRLKG